MHRAVGAHPGEGAIDLGDGDRAAPRDPDDVAAAELDARRDGTEDAAAAGDELPDGIGVDERGIARTRLDELEQPRVGRSEDWLRQRGTEPAIARAPSLPRTAQVILLAQVGSVASRGRPRRSTTA